MKYIGMDAHSSTCTFCVTDERGVELDNTELETNGRVLVDYLRSIEGNKKLTFEECELSHWLYTILHKEVEELVICNPVANREYKKNKTDKLDARGLAKLLRGDFLVSVFHNGSEKERFRGLMSGYQDLVDEAVRLKNRYKSLFRKEGRKVSGGRIYNDESLLRDFKREEFKFVGERTYRLLQTMEAERKEYLKEIARISKKFKEIKYLMTIPGIGRIQASKIVSQVIEAKRFRDKHKYYSYCGLVRHKRMSGGREYGSIKIRGNRILKCVYKMAAHSVLRGEGELRKYYDRLRSTGAGHKSAKNAVSRKIAAVSLSILKRPRRYEEKYVNNHLK